MPGTSTTIRGTTATSTRTTTHAHRPRSAGPAWILVLLLAWTLFAFAGAYPWTTAPLVAGAVLLAVGVRPSIGPRGLRALDFALVACVAIVIVQLVALPRSLRLALSPHIEQVESVLWLRDPSTAGAAAGRLSIDAGATRYALALLVAIVLVFWSAREIFSRGGVRLTARGVSATGLALAALALVQHAMSPTRLYGLYPTIFGAPFGPYLNRNDFATWLIMAVPLTIGYAVARIASQSRPGLAPPRLAAFTDGTTAWLAASVCLMSAALLASLSRSGLVAAVAALATFLSLSRGRAGRANRESLLIAAAIVAAIAVAYANLGALADRVGETLANGMGGRRVIWRETLPMVRDFAATGVGVGAYERGMLFYQRTKGLFYINHAHDEYLQLAAEGGVLLGIPALVALAAGTWHIRSRLRSDDSPMFWVRAGAASGLVAVAVQSVWDTGLRMPANATLFAVLGALALHRDDQT